MFWTIWQREYFGVKSLIGTPLDLEIFRRQKKIQLQVRGQEGIKIKICFSTIKDLLKWENTNIAIFVGQNCYGCRTIWSSISDAFFDRSESFSKLAKKSRMHHMITFIWEFLLRFSRKDVGRIFWWIIKLNWIENNECFKWRRPSENFYKYFLGRTLAGKKCITCLHPSKIILHYLKDVRRMSQNIIGTIPRGGSGAPQGVDPLCSW